MKRFLFILTTAIAFAALPVAAQSYPYIDNSRPDKVLTFGLRAGLNSSGVTTNYLATQPDLIQSNYYWRMGGHFGAIADLHIRNFLAIEVGLSWENRGYDCSMMAANTAEDYMGSTFVNNRYNYITIPTLLSFRLCLLKDANLHFDTGTYYSYGVLGNKHMHSYIAFGAEEEQLIFDQTITDTNYFEADPKDFLAVKRSDLGLQTGIGLTFFKHYFIGTYFKYSIKNNAKNREGSENHRLRNSSWSVSLGYNF